ncbi:MAG: hypothetical protein ACPGWR_05990 [Ardenticatenaceae bacterium]
MTPTLMGRWQTRLLLLGTIGLGVTLVFGRVVEELTTLLAVLGYVVVMGFVWDILYGIVQNFRWDQDWPPVLQLAAGVVEGVFLWGVIVLASAQFEGLPGVDGELSFGMFFVHYATVWITTFLATQGLLRIIFPRWRFHGGKWV